MRGAYQAIYATPSETPPAYAPYARAQDGEILWAAAARHLQPASLPPQPGQVVVFRLRRHLPARHLAIMSFEQKIIHALSGAHVCEVPFTRWWQRHAVACFAFPETPIT